MDRLPDDDFMDDGFVVYSVGPDGKDNTTGDIPARDDESGWQYPPGDDQLWPWPDPKYQRKQEK